MAAISMGIYVSFSDGTKIQNFHVGQTVNGYAYRDFLCSSLLVSRTADENPVTLTAPVSPAMVTFTEYLLNGQYLAQIDMYQNESTLVASFTGEPTGATVDAGQVVITFGIALDALTAQVPGRRLTTALIGNVPRI